MPCSRRSPPVSLNGFSTLQMTSWSGAGGASRVLVKAYGRFHSVDLSHPAVPGVVLHYDDPKEIVSDVSDARVYGGIHFRFDQDAAEAMGRHVANYNNSHILRKRGHQDQGDDDD